jgi:hypothetical protein
MDGYIAELEELLHDPDFSLWNFLG